MYFHKNLKPCVHDNCGQSALWESDTCAIHLADPKAYKKKVEEHVAAGKDLDAANFEGADLQGAALSLAKMREANLAFADLEEAVLEGARLQRARMDGANLKRVNLRGAHCEFALFGGATMDGADCDGADFKRANLVGTHAAGCSFRETDFYYSRPGNADVSDSDFSNANIQRAIFRAATIKGCQFETARGTANFENASQ